MADLSDVLGTAATVAAMLVGLGALGWLVQVGLAMWQERRQSQPIVWVHENRERPLETVSGRSAWRVDAHIENVGSGPAFNVRFGVGFNGVRFPYRMTLEDPETGNRQSVVKPGDRLPSHGSYPILITSEQIWVR